MTAQSITLGSLRFIAEPTSDGNICMRVFGAPFEGLGSTGQVVAVEEWESLVTTSARAESDAREVERLRSIIRGEPHCFGFVACGERDEKGIGHFCSAYCDAQDRAARLAVEVADLRAKLHGAEAAARALDAEIPGHVELNGHLERVEECRDWIEHQIMDGGDTSGRLRDFTESLGVIAENFDRVRRSRNWWQASSEAGKGKLIECAVDKALARAREAAKAITVRVSDLGSFVDDTDPRIIATAGPLGEAERALYDALGLDVEAAHAEMVADIDTRCAVCGWPLAESVDTGCTRGNCSYRPRPTVLYAPERAAFESHHKDPANE